MKKISLFCATVNPLKWEYPAKEFIEYHAPYVDEIIICDAGSTDGWLEYLKNIPKVKVIPFETKDLFSRFGQAGLQKAVARSYCQYEYMIHLDIDTFFIGIDKVQQLIEENPEVDIFPIRVIHFYGSFYKINPLFEGSDPYQHTVMKNLDCIGVGRSWDKSDGAEFIYITDKSKYKQDLGKNIHKGIWIRKSPLILRNTPVKFTYSEHKYCLYHYGWCCRSFETIYNKMKRQHTTQEKEWGVRPRHVFLKENDERLIDFKGKHPEPIERLIQRTQGWKWKFKEGAV